MVTPPKRRRIDLEQQPQVVVAHVLEVPARPRVTRHAGLPPRMVDDYAARSVDRGERLLVGHVREGQALRRELDVRAPGVIEWP